MTKNKKVDKIKHWLPHPSQEQDTENKLFTFHSTFKMEQNSLFSLWNNKKQQQAMLYADINYGESDTGLWRWSVAMRRINHN